MNEVMKGRQWLVSVKCTCVFEGDLDMSDVPTNIFLNMDRIE